MSTLNRSHDALSTKNSNEDTHVSITEESTTDIVTPAANTKNCFMRNRKCLIVTLSVIFLVLIGQRVVVYILKQFFEWVQSIGFWGNIMFVVMFFIVSFPFVLGGYIPLTMGAGSLYGVLYGTITVSIGSTLGGILAYWICKRLADRWLDMSVLRSSSHFQLFTNILKASEHTFVVTLLARWAPMPYGLQNIFFVLAEIPFRDFVIVTWIGLLPLQVLYTYFGSTLRSLSKVAAGEVELNQMQKISIILQVVVVLGLISYFIYLSRKAQRTLQSQQADIVEMQSLTEEEV